MSAIQVVAAVPRKVHQQGPGCADSDVPQSRRDISSRDLLPCVLDDSQLVCRQTSPERVLEHLQIGSHRHPDVGIGVGHQHGVELLCKCLRSRNERKERRE